MEVLRITPRGSCHGVLTGRGRGAADAAMLAAPQTENGTGAEVEVRIDALVEEACRAIAGSTLDATWRSELTGMAAQVAYRDR